MKIRAYFTTALLLFGLLLFSGCGTTEEAQDEETAFTKPDSGIDRGDVPAKDEPAPPAEERTIPPSPAAEPSPAATPDLSLPAGKFSVQLGAFSMPEKAQQAAAAARSRFNKKVYIMRDDRTGNMKVMVGDFEVKDDARRFRDQLIQQYPDDYKDAWVFEVPQH